MSDNATKKGIALAFSGALVLSFDTLLLRLVNADPLTIAFWRGVLMFATGLCVCMILRVSGNGRLGLFNGRSGLAAAVLYGLASVGFVASAMLTSIANMLVIVATAPLWAAIGATLFLKEQTSARTWAASTTALIGIAYVMSPGLSGSLNKGDMVALLTAWSMAGAFVVSRYSQANLALAPATGGLISALALVPFVREFSFDRAEQVWLMALEGGLLVPIALGLIAAAPRYLPAPQVGLFLLLETVLGPLWIWTILGEAPKGHVLIGGAIVVFSLIAHAALSLYAQLRPAKATEVTARI